MTDSELLRLLRSIDAHRERINAIIERIEESARSDAHEIGEALREECHSIAWAEHVGGRFLGKAWVNKHGTYVNEKSNKEGK